MQLFENTPFTERQKCGKILGMKTTYSKNHTEATPKEPPRPTIWRGVLAGLITAGLAIAVWHFIVPKPELPLAPEPTATRPKPKAKPTPPPVQEPKVKEEEKPTKEPSLRQQMQGLSPDERLEVMEKKLAATPIPEGSTNRVFRTGLEQVMGWIFTTEVGEMPPPLPNISNFDYVHIEDILNITNAVYETDSEKAADAKRTVDFAKQELRKYLEKGGDPQEFLAYYHSELQAAYKERSLVRSQAMQILKEEPDLALDFLERANQQLEEKGIKPAVIPERVLRRYGISLEQ